MIRSILLLGSLLVLRGLVAQGGHAPQRIAQQGTMGTRSIPVALFEHVPETPGARALWWGACTKADVLRMDTAAVIKLLTAKPAQLVLELPSASGNYILELYHADITAPGFRVVEASSEVEVHYEHGLHYRGVIRGVPGSLAAISVFGNEVMGLLADQDGQLVLGLSVGNADGLHVFYRDSDLRAASGKTCHTTDGGDVQPSEQPPMEGPMKSIRCVRFHWEVNHDIFLDKGSVTNATNYVTGLFNQSAILFDNDGISVTLQEVFVWNVPSPYTQTSTFALLEQFGITRTSFNGDLAHLLGYAGNGGVAWLNTLCNSQTNLRMAYSDINSTYATVPTYSWSVEVVTHEQGHNMGSRHTHACAWNGNNTAIDGCGPAAGYSEGSCPQGPIPPSSVGGTIMSYCHLTSSTIKFVNGFGPQPAALIVDRVNSSSCLSTSCGSSCDPPSGLIAFSITSASAQLSWASVGASSYSLRWRISPTGTWTTVTGLATNSYSLTGLAQATAYDVEVMSGCGSTSSVWSATYTFSTLAPCLDALEPNNSLVTAADLYMPATVNALIASSADVDHYRITVGTTSTISLFLSDLAGDYDMRLLDASGVQLAISQAGGTSNESISYGSAVAGNYYIHIYGWNGAFSSSQCYLLNASVSTAQNCAFPAGLAASAITWNSANLTWGNVGPANTYSLQWRPAQGGPWNIVTGLAQVSQGLSGLEPATTYEARVMSVCNAGGSAWSGPMTFTTEALPCELAPSIQVSVKVLLDGPFKPEAQLMVDSLRSKGLLPVQEPYTALGHVVTGPQLVSPSVFSITGPNAIVDWVLVELRDPLLPAAVIEARAALLQRDGDVVALNGTSPLGFCLPAGNYRVAVRHRNHLGCMTSMALALGEVPSALDLSSPVTDTHGSEARKTVGGFMTLWSGNVVTDDLVKYTGSWNDRDEILAVIGGSLPTNTIIGYNLADVNLDGLVKYTGLDNDRDPILSNIGGGTPTNTRVEQVP